MANASTFSGGTSNRSIPSATVIPVLQYPDVPAAAAWLCRAFGFSERLRIFTHRIQLNAGDGALVVAEAPDAASASAPPRVSIMVRITSADAHSEIAKRAGAVIVNPPTTYPFGERQYTATDFAGHVWTFTETVEDVDPAAWGGELV